MSFEFVCVMVEEWVGKFVGEFVVVDLGLVGVLLFMFV